MSLLKSGWNLLPRRLSVLIYHRLLAEPDPMRPGFLLAQQFEQHLMWLAQVANVMPLPEAVEALYAGRLPPRAVAITFDDGYREDYQIARPLLQRCGMSATFFVTTAFLEQGALWTDLITEAVRVWPSSVLPASLTQLNDLNLTTSLERTQAAWAVCRQVKYWPSAQRQQLALSLWQAAGSPKTQLMMSPEQIRSLSKTMDVGGHTHSHPILTSLSPADAALEIQRNRDILSSLIDKPLLSFAYPNGAWQRDFNQQHCQLVQQAGYKLAVSTNWGVNSIQHDPFKLVRFTPWDKSRWRFQLRLLLNYGYRP